MNELLTKLSQGTHVVELALRPERNLRALKECLERGYVHVKFVGTQGGTELGISVDEKTSQLAIEAMQGGESTIELSGRLSLDYAAVRCVANINLDTYAGSGCLEIVQ
jgi:hypothetical protein